MDKKHKQFRYIPIRPEDIDHVVDLLREDFTPVPGEADPAKAFRGLSNPANVPSIIEAELQAAWLDAGEGLGRIESMSDYLHAIQWVDPYALSLAHALGVIHQINADSEFQVLTGTDPGFFDEPWKELKAALVEVALWNAVDRIEYWAERHADASLRIPKGGLSRAGRRKGSIGRQTRYLVDLIEEMPELTAKEVAKVVRERAGTGDNPFDVEAGIDVMRATGKPCNLVYLIENARKRHVNRSDTAK